MEMWALYIQLNCSEPRLPFRTFYERVYATKYPGERGEDISSVWSRVFDAAEQYIDYSTKYLEKCR